MNFPDTVPALVELLVKAVPYPHLISQLELLDGEIRVSWRGTRYRVSVSMHVEEIGDGVLIGSDKAILLEGCLKNRVGLPLCL